MDEGKMVLFICREPDESSEYLLYRSAKLFAEQMDFPNATFRVLRQKGKKPKFSPDYGIYFSISHARGIWACLFASVPVGLDVEVQRPCNEVKIAERFFHPDEARLIRRDRSFFFRVWTAKESYVKYTGEGITDAFGLFSVVDNNVLADRIKDTTLRYIEENIP
jgi:4'-phosphopantetheinyl transferase